MKLRPNVTPLETMFPLFGHPRLRVTVRGRTALHDAARNRVLDIEVVNAPRTPVEVPGVYASFRYTHLLSEVVSGRRTDRFPLHELEGDDPLMLPHVLGVGESVTWTADLRQLEELLEEQGLTLPRGCRLYSPEAYRADVERWGRRGRLGIMVRNRMVMMSNKRLAVAVRDDLGNLYKAKVRWEPPGGSSSHPLRPQRD